MRTTILILILLSATCSAMAQTNVVAPDRVETTLTTLTNYLTAILAILTAILGWWGRNKAKVAALVPTLIRSIEAHGTPELKAAVKSESDTLRIEPTMSAQVRALTASVDKPATKS